MRGVTYDVPAMTEYIASLLAKYRPELAALPSYHEITGDQDIPKPTCSSCI
jgi:hypothetical protein